MLTITSSQCWKTADSIWKDILEWEAKYNKAENPGLKDVYYTIWQNLIKTYNGWVEEAKRLQAEGK